MYIVNYTIGGQTRQRLINNISNARKFARITKQNGYKVNYIKNNRTGKRLTKIY